MKYVSTRILFRIALISLALGAVAPSAFGTEVTLKDGRVLVGGLGVTASLGEPPQPSDESTGKQQTVVIVDDDLRRYFVPRRLVQEITHNDANQVLEFFKLKQRVLKTGGVVRTVGPAVSVQPFDEYGRRTYAMISAKGDLNVIQGITELRPKWAKVQGISHVWDMRIAVSSIPRDSLQKMLQKQIDENDPEGWKRIARFYIQAERYEDALKMLDEMGKRFSDRTDMQKELEPIIRSVRQLAGQRLLKELQMRRDAGQHKLVYDLLKKFPSEDVGGETLQGIREGIEEYEKKADRRVKIITSLDDLLAKLPDSALRERAKKVRDEIDQEMTLNVIGRMAAYMQSLDDGEMSANDKVSLAVGGWLLGADAAAMRLPAALSVFELRDSLASYLNRPSAAERRKILTELRSAEGASAETVAALISKMKPPAEPPKPVSADAPGLYYVETPDSTKDSPLGYWIQLPPEYDPYRTYPTVVSLHGLGGKAQDQITWWAGELKNGMRTGQAARRGYIVIAPEWASPRQKQYDYTSHAHAIVLSAMRDACRRFSIDTDRVYLAGFSDGGSAAWDIGLSHPDLWAGVIPISAQCEAYSSLYWENAKNVPFYVVFGELDNAKLSRLSRDLDRYMIRGFDATVVEFHGRGHEDFYDEIQNIFDWMSRFKRNFYPKEFTCVTMRPTDNFFWWLEAEQFPAKSMVEANEWPLAPGIQPARIRGAITPQNGINIQTGSGQLVIWLSPKMLDFKQRSNITVNGKRINATDQFITPDVKTILEDVRTRGDRLNPFWAKIDVSTGKAPVKN